MSHSPIGPSAAKRILACPGSVGLVAKAPPQESSKYAEEGTRAHEVAELYVLGKPIPSWATEEMIDGAKMYAGLLEDITLASDNIQIPLKLEAKVLASSIRNDAFGTCDAFLMADDVLEVIDYKFGKGVQVDAFMNVQLLYYALGVVDTYNILPKKIKLRIVQPRNEGISTWEIEPEIAYNFKDRMRAALRSNDLNINEDCRWCPALAFCPKQLDNIKDKFDVSVGEPIKKLPSIEAVNPDIFKHYLDNADLLESWIKAVRSQAFSAIGRGMVIDGYELTEGLGNRKWQDKELAEKAFYLSVGGNIYDKTLKSPTQMEKIVPKEIVEKYTVRESTGKRLTKTEKQAPDLFNAFNVIGE
jgi:hypothetical protein